ncbi:glycosyltransferase [Planctomycetaceae bacterium SH139]
MRVAIACYDYQGVSNTFIRTHAQRLPCETNVIVGAIPRLHGQKLSSAIVSLGFGLFAALGARRSAKRTIITAAYLSAIRKTRPDVVLAEFGPTAVLAMDACRIERIPLVAHFHGYDASRHSTLIQYRDDYRRLFSSASAVIGVSREMCDRLVSLGADATRVHHVVYGIDCDQFHLAKQPATKTFLAVGRLTPKKAPLLTIDAFAKTREVVPESQLIMIGDGPLMGECKKMVRKLGQASAVEFRGPQSHQQVSEAMRQASVFVQHSVEAADGDREGTPVAILEAAACGLPIVATRHGGIPDVVRHQREALLVNEQDVSAMAKAMISLVTDLDLGSRLGTAAAKRVREEFTAETSIEKLYKIVRAAADGK